MKARWLIGLAIGLTLTGGALDALDDWVARTDLPPLMVKTGAEVLARDGSLLRAFQVSDGRWRLAPGPVDEGFLNLLVAYEDRRFYDHSGVDLRAMIRAAAQALWRQRIVSGGSTLTMQVARLLEDGPTGSWPGKMRQIRVALALEQRLDKAQILDLYLRLAPYGGNLEGVRAASLAWFGKEPARLTPAQSALLVALPQSPGTRRPDRAPLAARQARARVLAAGQATGLLDADTVRAALAEPLPDRRRAFPALAPHLSARLHRDAPQALRITTTIDADLQRAAQALARRAVAGQGESVSVAMIFADHQSGEILAHIGGADWTSTPRAGFLDLTEAIRSPGSTLKPFAYALAFDDGRAHPETLIEDRPVSFGRYAPQNFDRQFRGTISLRDALKASLNIPAVRLTDAVGPARLSAALAKAGAPLRVPGGEPGLALVLGGGGVSLQGLAQAYAGLAEGGQVTALSPLPGEGGARPARLFGPVAAWQVGQILSDIPPPPGARPGRLAYKTGTSYGHRDALAIGFDGRWLGAVWMGRADGTPVPGAFGGELAAPVLFELFERAGHAPEPLPPPPPATLMVPNAALPPPLRRFRSREELLAAASSPALSLIFPPDGAELEAPDGSLIVKVRDGTPPYTWLRDGEPVAVAQHRPDSLISLGGPGYTTLTVIDARGQSSSVTVHLRAEPGSR